MDLHFLPAHRLARLVRDRKIGCLELLDLHLERVQRHDPVVNAVVVRDFEQARADAKAADNALGRGEVRGPLHGVPITVKESFDVAGLPTTWGRPDFAKNIAADDAEAVMRLRDAGAVVFGKTNVPTNLADWQTFNAIHGTTHNPWDPTRVPGGSSGGAAAALAAGMTALETGSDIGGSIRNPAHYCGVYGHKPTFGICSTRGQALPGFDVPQDISVIGPLARSPRDLEIALGLLAGPDPVDHVGWTFRLPKANFMDVDELRVAVMLDAPVAPVDREVSDRISEVARALAHAGADVSDRARPAIDLLESHRTFIRLLRGATCGALSDAVFAGQVERAARVSPGDDDYEAWMLRANTMTHREWHHWDEQRLRLRRAWAEFFEFWDVLICPAAASAAFHHDQKGERWERMIPVNGKPQPSTTQMFWAGLPGVANLPATVAPAGLTRGGLPVGVQIIGPQFGDLNCIAVAKILEKVHGGFVPPPGYE